MNASQPSAINVRRYLVVCGTMMASVLLTVGVALAPLGDHRINIALALVVIVFEAFLVLGFMMHLLSERHAIYSVLAFTAFFLVSLMFMTVSSVREVVHKPHQDGNTVTHFSR